MKPARSYAALGPVTLSILLVACSSTQPKPVDVNLAVFNDFHGYLQPAKLAYPDTSAPDGKRIIEAGGIDVLGGVINHLRHQDPELLVIASGDLISGSPPISSLWADEPTIEAMNLLGLQLSAVGNHELDNGKNELLRIVNGGCASNRPQKACQLHKNYQGARFTYLAANLIDNQTGKPVFPAYKILEAHGQKIAFVGAVLKDVARIVSPAGMDGLSVQDEADAINAQIPAIKAQGVEAIVAVIHQGGGTRESYNTPDCAHLQGPIVEITKRLDPAVDVVASAHTHQSYTCHVDNRLVFQGGSYGQFVSHVRLGIDPKTHDIVSANNENLTVDAHRYTPDPKLAALRQEVEARSQHVLQRPIARLAVPQITRSTDANGESALGDLIADAQLQATRKLGAQIAFMNGGGIRSNFTLEPGQSKLTYAQLAANQPFGNTLTLLTLSGAQLYQLMEEQWESEDSAGLMQVSEGFSYRWDPAGKPGQKVVSGSLRLNGQPIRLDRDYRIVVNNFMAQGGDGLDTLKQGRQVQETGILDVDALEQYLVSKDASGAPAGRATPAGRIQRL
ncbi:bifunctional metallophosphatase/5'-nucleotidase [Pseudomonas asuensis]|uniref:Multifunctional 2',3'-cyclic-nucleotide 2'-phosphodiesterase/5'-nucleotidase/3'-nucleotidase n=1 Tax=Pseudomonas asuensis TaxID=1825787 RepID=A0ABQ2GJ11_9PSED|nr:bifunctional metallophosphatase/5'-nucleotidase [Pseudomonas asuensis]GGL98569.1 multifunctional 2',3'-cyclic-nucleotide 2'-phosphodiesterase/5'-nucleotidase/3'-nucleotidase [Pseudomonas asuensis]